MLVGLILPLSAYFIADVFFKNLLIAGKPGVPYLIAAAINLFLIRFCYKRDADKAAIGIFIVTFLTLLLTFIFKIRLR